MKAPVEKFVAPQLVSHSKVMRMRIASVGLQLLANLEYEGASKCSAGRRLNSGMEQLAW